MISLLLIKTTSAIIEINSCQTLNTAGELYQLNTSISSNGTCITVTAANIILDCNGYSMTGNQSGDGVSASSINNITVKNCEILNFSRGIYYYFSNNGEIRDTNISVIHEGVHLQYSNHDSVINVIAESTATTGSTSGLAISGSAAYTHNNSVINSTFTSNSNEGIMIVYSNHSLINSTGIGTTGIHVVAGSGNYIQYSTGYGTAGHGFYITSNYSRFVNINASGALWDGISLNGAVGNNITNSTLSGRDDIHSYSGSTNNIILNCSFDQDNLNGDGFTIKWYLNLQVVNSNGDGVDSASVNVTDADGDIAYSVTTNSNGWITGLELAEFTGSGNDKKYNTPHTFTASNTTFTNTNVSKVDSNKDSSVTLGPTTAYSAVNQILIIHHNESSEWYENTSAELNSLRLKTYLDRYGITYDWVMPLDAPLDNESYENYSLIILGPETNDNHLLPYLARQGILNALRDSGVGVFGYAMNGEFKEEWKTLFGANESRSNLRSTVTLISINNSIVPFNTSANTLSITNNVYDLNTATQLLNDSVQNRIIVIENELGKGKAVYAGCLFPLMLSGGTYTTYLRASIPKLFRNSYLFTLLLDEVIRKPYVRVEYPLMVAIGTDEIGKQTDNATGMDDMNDIIQSNGFDGMGWTFVAQYGDPVWGESGQLTNESNPNQIAKMLDFVVNGSHDALVHGLTHSYPYSNVTSTQKCCEFWVNDTATVPYEVQLQHINDTVNYMKDWGFTAVAQFPPCYSFDNNTLKAVGQTHKHFIYSGGSARNVETVLPNKTSAVHNFWYNEDLDVYTYPSTWPESESHIDTIKENSFYNGTTQVRDFPLFLWLHWANSNHRANMSNLLAWINENVTYDVYKMRLSDQIKFYDDSAYRVSSIKINSRNDTYINFNITLSDINQVRLKISDYIQSVVINGSDYAAFDNDTIFFPKSNGSYNVAVNIADSSATNPHLQKIHPGVYIDNANYESQDKKIEVKVNGTGWNKTFEIIYNVTENFLAKDNDYTFATISSGIITNSNSSYFVSYDTSTGVFNFTLPTMSEHEIILQEDNINPTPSFSCSPTSVYTGETITCSCTATDAVDSTPSVSYTTNPSTSDTGTHTTTCTATDDAGNSASSSISYTVFSSIGGGGTPSFWTNTIVKDEKEFSEIKIITRELKAKERVRIKINDEVHYIGVAELTNTTATIEIFSTSQKTVFNIGDENKFEVTDDEYYDIYVRLNSILDNKANLTMMSIYEQMSLEEEPVTENVVKEQEERNLTWLWVVLGVVVVLVIGVSVGVRKK